MKKHRIKIFGTLAFMALVSLGMGLGIWGQALPGTATLATGSISAPYLTIGGTAAGPVFSVTAPSASGWTQVNWGGSTATAVNGSLVLNIQPNLGNANIRCYMRSIGASSGYTASIGFLSTAWILGAAISDGTKYILAAPLGNGTFHYDTWNTTSNGNGSATITVGPIGSLQWARFQDTGGDRTFSTSADGQNWRVIKSETTASFLTETTFGVCYYTDQAPFGMASIVDLRITIP